MSSATILTISNVVKHYGEMIALHSISLDVTKGEFIALVGPSGSGKSTLLKCISGFDDASSGTISIDGQNMEGVSPAQRPTSMVFQKLALFPHKTIAQNIGFPLKLRKVPQAKIDAEVARMMALMKLKPEYLNRYPKQLSGGEQQRVALARSMISSPKLLLLDEPLSALDVKLKKVLQAEIKRLHREMGVTFVHVTHDLEEAMMLSDRICVMNGGRIEQVGTPYDIYYRPATSFVAGFISETNLFDIDIVSAAGKTLNFKTEQFQNSKSDVGSNMEIGSDQAAIVETSKQAMLMVRPEFLRPLKNKKDADFTVDATVDEYFVKGSTIQFICTSTGQKPKRLILEIRGQASLPYDVGAKILLGFDRKDVFVFQNKPVQEAG